MFFSLKYLELISKHKYNEEERKGEEHKRQMALFHNLAHFFKQVFHNSKGYLI